MCTGVELALLAGGVMKGIGAKQEGDFAASIAGINQDVARFQQRSARVRGDEAVRRVREQARAIIGAQNVGYATQGLSLDTGTPLEMRTDTAVQGERLATDVRNNALLEAWGYKMQALDFGLQKEQAKKGGLAGLAGGVLGGLGQAFG